MIVSAFAALVSNGGAPRASMAMGKGDYDEAEKILGNSVALQMCIRDRGDDEGTAGSFLCD